MAIAKQHWNLMKVLFSLGIKSAETHVIYLWDPAYNDGYGREIVINMMGKR